MWQDCAKYALFGLQSSSALWLKQMQRRNIPTVVWISPILPFTMRAGSREPFYQALDKHFPQLKQRYVDTYGYAYNCASPNHNKLMQQLIEQCDKYGVMRNVDEIFAYPNGTSKQAYSTTKQYTEKKHRLQASKP